MAARQKRPPPEQVELAVRKRARPKAPEPTELDQVRAALATALDDLKRLERAQDLLDLCEEASVDYSTPAHCGPYFTVQREADAIARAIVLWRARPNELERLKEQDAKRPPEPPTEDP